MGIFTRNRNLPSTLPTETVSTPGQTSLDRITASGNAIASKATRIYKENPKLIGGIALIASALLLNRMKRPRV